MSLRACVLIAAGPRGDSGRRRRTLSVEQARQARQPFAVLQPLGRRMMVFSTVYSCPWIRDASALITGMSLLLNFLGRWSVRRSVMTCLLVWPLPAQWIPPQRFSIRCRSITVCSGRGGPWRPVPDAGASYPRTTVPASESRAEFLARADPELAEDLVQMSIAPDWEQRVGVAGAFDPAHDRPGSPDGTGCAGRRATTLA